MVETEGSLNYNKKAMGFLSQLCLHRHSGKQICRQAYKCCRYSLVRVICIAFGKLYKSRDSLQKHSVGDAGAPAF